jgi:hypothetical protein
MFITKEICVDMSDNVGPAASKQGKLNFGCNWILENMVHFNFIHISSFLFSMYFPREN